MVSREIEHFDGISDVLGHLTPELAVGMVKVLGVIAQHHDTKVRLQARLAEISLAYSERNADRMADERDRQNEKDILICFINACRELQNVEALKVGLDALKQYSLNAPRHTRSAIEMNRYRYEQE